MLELLYLIFISPIEEGIRFVFEAAFSLTNSYGFSIILLAMVVNIVLIPIYHFAEKLQNTERLIANRISPYIYEIKSVYKGQERHMMLKTLYRQNHYHPIMTLRASGGLLIQLPVFVAAFHFLGNYTALQGVAFGPFTNLGQPDGLLAVAGVSVNVMPFVMTIVNLLSVLVYTRRKTRNDKIQVYVISGVFLVLLYTAPVALVLYWTISNIFSLIKNVFYEKYRTFDARQVESAIDDSRGTSDAIGQKAEPSLFAGLKNRIQDDELFAHILVPAIFIAFSLCFFNPILVLISAPERLGELSSGHVSTFFYYAIAMALALIFPKMFFGRRYLNGIICLAIVILAYSYIISFDYGLFRGNSFGNEDRISSLAKILFIPECLGIILCYYLISKLSVSQLAVFRIYFSLIFAMLAVDVGRKVNNYLSHYPVVSAEASVSDSHADLQQTGFNKNLMFSKKHKNIVLIVPDAGSGYLIPKIFSDKEILSGFSGFTYFPNTVAVGNFTMSNTASLLAGENYTPSRINEYAEKHEDKTLEHHVVDAYNWLTSTVENQGYQSIIIDPKWLDCGQIRANHCSSSRAQAEVLKKTYHYTTPAVTSVDSRTILAFSIFRVLPAFLKSPFYKSDFWNGTLNSEAQLAAAVNRYVDYLYIDALKHMSYVDTESDKPAFIHLWSNELIAPFHFDGSCGALQSDGTHAYDMYSKASRENATRCFLSSLSQWFEWMKANDVFDNTKIIIAADHGAENYNEDWFKGAVNPILLIKDFDQQGVLRTSQTLMQNSDVPAIICATWGGCDGIPDDPSTVPFENREAIYHITENGNRDFLQSSQLFNIKKTYIITGNIYDDKNFQLDKRMAH